MSYGELPVDLGLYNVDVGEKMYYQYLPIKLRNSREYFIEPRLYPFKDLIDSINTDFMNMWGYKTWKKNNIYLTVKRMYVCNGRTFNRTGYHSDGFMTEDINYVWCDHLPTIYNSTDFVLDQDDTISLKQMTEQASINNEKCYEDGTLLRLNQFNIHKVNESTAFTGTRTFLKVSFSLDKYDLKDNSRNYLLKTYWNTRERGTERNMPQSGKYRKRTKMGDNNNSNKRTKVQAVWLGGDNERAVKEAQVIADHRLAITDPHFKLIELFLSNGGSSPKNCVAEAIKTGDFEIAKMLIEEGGDVNAPGNPNPVKPWVTRNVYSPLMLLSTIRGGDKGIKRLLLHMILDKGVDINMKNVDGDTALHCAIRGRCFSVAQILIQRGADVNVRNNKGWAPILLVVDGCLDYDGCQPNNLDSCSYKHEKLGPQLAILKLLMDNGADVDALDLKGYSPFMYAVKCGCDKIVSVMMIGMEDNINLCVQGETPLTLALTKPNHSLGWDSSVRKRIGKGRISIVDMLLGHPHIDVNKCNENDETPLMCALDRGIPRVTKLLAEKGVSLGLHGDKPGDAFVRLMGDLDLY
jgi:ankyrin repeat protein